MSPQTKSLQMQSSIGHSPTSLLVVDDEEMNRDMLSRRLAREGYSVDVAKDGASALNMMKIERYDMVLLDIMMPNMDGFQVLQTIKTNAALKGIPVIMLTALTDPRAKERCLNLGACDFLEKPFNLVTLKSRIWNCYNKTPSIREGSTPASNFDGSTVLIVDDEEMNLDLLSRRTRQIGLIPYCADSGEAAMRIMAKQKIDLILLDIMMAKMDGYEVLKRIRSIDDFKKIPIIMISALGEANSVEKCMRLGANYYIVKPFNAAVLKEKLTSFLMEKKTRDAEQEKREALAKLAEEGRKLIPKPDR